MFTIILNLILDIINSERYLATQHRYQSDKNVKWSDKPFHDKDLVLNYPIALMSILNTRHNMSPLVQFNIERLDIFSCYAGGQNPSRSLVSLNMIHPVPINRLYSHPVMDDVCTITKYLTPTSRIHNYFGSNVEYIIYHYENVLWLLHNVLCSILMTGQSNINITPNIYTYVKTW